MGNRIRLSARAEHLGDMSWWELEKSVYCKRSGDHRDSNFVLNQGFVTQHNLFENWRV